MMLYKMAVWGLMLGFVSGCGGRPGEREFEKALQQLERGRWVRARDLFQKSVTRRPGHEENAWAYHYLGYISWRLDDPEAARVFFEQSRDENPSLVEPVYNLAILAYHQGDVTQASSLFKAAAQLQPQNPDPLEFLSRMYMDHQNWRDARRTLHEALNRAPHSARILTALACVDMETGGPATAVNTLMQALEKDPTYPPALYNLGRVYEQVAGEEEDALAYFQDYINTGQASGAPLEYAIGSMARLRGDPSAPPLREKEDIARPKPRPEEPVRRVTFDELLAQSRALAADGRIEQGVALCHRAAVQARQQGRISDEERAHRTAVEIGPDQARAHYALGRFLQLDKQYPDALRAFRRTTELDPTWTRAYLALAECAVNLKEYDVALTALLKAVELEPGQTEPLWALATLYDQTGVGPLALRYYQQFRERFPDDPRTVRAGERATALQASAPPEPPPKPVEVTDSARKAARQAFERARSYQKNRDWDDAIFYYRRALENDPSLNLAYQNLGMIYLETRDWLAAQEVYENILERDPKQLDIRYNLALVLRELGREDEALAHVKTVLKEDPNHAAAHLLAGLIYSQYPGMQARTKEHYVRYLALQPDAPNAAAVREWVAVH